MMFSLQRLHWFFALYFLLIFITVSATGRPGNDQAATRKFESLGDDFNPMSRDEIRKVAAEAFANASTTKLNRLTDEQLRGVGESLARSTNTTVLDAVMNKLTRDKALELAAKMVDSKNRLSRRIKAKLFNDIKKKFGDDLSRISRDNIKRLGPRLLQHFSKDDIKKIAKNKDAFNALAGELATIQDLPDNKRKAITEGAKTLFGKPDTWDQDTVGRYGGFARLADLDKIGPAAIKGALDQLEKNKGIKRTNARRIISKLADSKGLGRPGSWNATTLRRLGGLAKGLKASQIKDLNPTALKDSMDALGKLSFSKSQAKAFIDQIVKSKALERWESDDLKKAGKLIKGLSPQAIKELQGYSVKQALRELGGLSRELTLEQRREFAKEIEQPKAWNATKAREVGNLCYGISSEQLKEIAVNTAKVLVAAMTPEKSAPEAKNRILKEKIFNAGNVNLTITGAVVLAMTLNDLQNANPKRELGLDQAAADEKKGLPWKQAPARQLIDNFKEQEGQPDTWTEKDVSALVSRGLLTGCSTKDISKLNHFPLEDFADDYHRLIPAQRQAVVKKFKEIIGVNKLTTPDIEAMGNLVGELPNKELENLPKDVAVTAFRKMGEDRMFGKKPNQEETLKLVMKTLDLGPVEEINEDAILDLGNFLCWMTLEQIAKIPMAAFNATKAEFGEKKCFSPKQLEAVAKKAKEAIDIDKMTSEDILELNVIIKGFTADDLRKIRDTVIQEIEDFFANLKLSSEKAKVLMEKIAKQASRRRRSTDVSSKTGQELIAMGNMLLGLTSSDIATVKNIAFDEAASTIGKIDGFSQDQLEAWAAKAKQAWNIDVAMFNEDQLLRLGAIAIGFSDSDLEKMALSSEDVIESLGSQNVKSAEAHGYTLSQLTKALNRIITLKGKTIDKFSGAEISNLNNFSLALTVAEIGSIPKETFLNCIGSFGKLNGWTEDQMKKLKEKAVQAHGPVSGWSPAKLRESGSTIGGFSKAELQSLSGEHLSVIAPEAIRTMPPSLFAGFTSSQLQQLDYIQAGAVTKEQMDALPEDSRNILKTKTGVLKPGNSGASGTYLSQVFSVTIILSTLLVISN